MISNWELSQVGLWATKVAYPPKEYIYQAKEALTNAVNLFNDKYKGIRYNIFFSNATEIELEIFEMNVAHMLGIDCENIKSDYHANFRKDVLGLNPDYKPSSYNLLKKIVTHFDDLTYYESQINNSKILNYYTILIKCAIFEKLLDLSKFNYACINIDKDEYAKNNNKIFRCNSKKLLVVESEETNSPYFFMGILPFGDPSKKNEENVTSNDNSDVYEESTLYAVETLLAPSNPNEFLKNQEVVIPTHLIYSKNFELNKLEASPEQKLALLKMYKSAIEKYSLENRLNVYGDYALTLNNHISRR